MADEILKSVRVPLAVTLGLSQFSGPTVTQFSSYLKNAVVDTVGPEPDQKLYVRQRPAFAIVEDNITAKTAGRGIFFWDSNSTLYYVNDDTVYRGAYTSVGTVDAGTKKCYFTQIGLRLLLTDPENNKAYTIQTNHTLTQVTSSGFPTTLAEGVVTLNGKAYVMDESGVIYNSATDDGTTWSAIEFVDAERQPDGGVYLGLHYDHIAAFGPKTLEFFQDRANPTGSPLSRREDIFYNVGAISGESIWQVGDVIYFLGTESKGSVNVYKLEGFQLTKLTEYGVNTYLTNLVYREEKGVLFSGFQAQGKTYLMMTPYDTTDDSYSDGYYTFAYCPETDFWHWFGTGVTDIGTEDALEIVDWTIRSGTSPSLGRGITASGTIISIYDSLGSVDIDEGAYVEAEYWPEDYVEGGGSTAIISIVIRTGPQDGGTSNYKFGRFLQIAGDYTTNPADITVLWSDTTSADADFTGGNRTIDLNTKHKLSRLGRFIRRSHQLEFDVAEPIRLEALEMKYAEGNK